MEGKVEKSFRIRTTKKCNSLLLNFLCYGLNLSYSGLKLMFLLPAVTAIQIKHEENSETNI